MPSTNQEFCPTTSSRSLLSRLIFALLLLHPLLSVQGAMFGTKSSMSSPALLPVFKRTLMVVGSVGTKLLGKRSTAKEVVDFYSKGNDQYLEGKVAVVTGGNSGIGLETVKALASKGCRVIMGSRNEANGIKAIETEVVQMGEGKYAVPKGKELIRVCRLDLEDLNSVKDFANSVLQHEPRIDFLVLNAGIMAVEKLELTKAGFERQIGTNHFGHFYLTSLLRNKLSSQSGDSRVVVLSSSAHTFGSIDVNDLHYQHGRRYSPWGAYGQSKLANLLFAKELSDQSLAAFKTGGSTNVGRVSSTAVHPGVIHTPLWRNTPVSLGGFLGRIIAPLLTNKSIPQGAATTLYACLEPTLQEEGKSGSYLSDCSIAEESALAKDSDGSLRRSLWRVTQEQLDKALSSSGSGANTAAVNSGTSISA